MKWMGRRGSENIEDRRGMSGKQVATGGGILAIIMLVIGLLMGGDPQQLISDFAQQQSPSAASSSGPVEETKEEKEMVDFISVVLADNEQIWEGVFTQNQLPFKKPVLVLFRNATQSPCGSATAQSGPFYCPADQKIYLDLTFFDELRTRLGAHGDFSCAYVIAHEYGHHIQNLLGTSGKVQQLMSRKSEKEANRLSVALELQADFYAGVWAHYDQKINKMLEDGDIDEALSAANAVGDDRLQKNAQGYVVPDAFTHGTSEQRMKWFMLGFNTGDLNQGDTFRGL
ncbi:MAG: neutral zinc metallopeptidase [Chitinophagaceae bacterium]|nr:neutral zinc metallopeptidase [Chitinophagaceae bacterium]